MVALVSHTHRGLPATTCLKIQIITHHVGDHKAQSRGITTRHEVAPSGEREELRFGGTGLSLDLDKTFCMASQVDRRRYVVCA